MKLDAATLATLTPRERAVIDTIDRLGVFGGKTAGELEVVEAIGAKDLNRLFTDPEDQRIAAALLARFYPQVARQLEAERVPAIGAGPGSLAAPETRLGRLFAPRSVAVVGASRDAGKVGGALFKNLLDTAAQKIGC